MPATLQTMRAGGTQHPEQIMNFLASRIVTGEGGVYDKDNDSLEVQEQAVPDMTVNVNQGYAFLRKGSSSMVYPVRLYDADYTQNISSNSSGNPRIDAVVLYVDLGASPNSDITNVAKITVVEGTPAGSPSAPSDGDIETAIGASNPFLRLANVTVASGETAINTTDISDQRREVMFDFYKKINAPRGFLLNGKIVPSVASNNLTVAIKTLDGKDPSANDPVYCRIGDTTRTIVSALSVTKNAGTNWFNAGSSELATKEIDYFVYLGYNATDGVVIGFSRIPYATEYDDFSTTSTNEKYCAISTITNASAGDDYENIGRFSATLSAGAGYTWSVPTFTNKNLIQRPIYETRWTLYIPQYGGFSSAPSPSNCKFKIINDTVLIRYRDSAGTSNATTFTISSPFASALSAAPLNACIVTDNGIRSGPAYAEISTSTITLYKNGGLTAWTNSGSKGCEGLNGFYLI